MAMSVRKIQEAANKTPAATPLTSSTKFLQLKTQATTEGTEDSCRKNGVDG